MPGDSSFLEQSRDMTWPMSLDEVLMEVEVPPVGTEKVLVRCGEDFLGARSNSERRTSQMGQRLHGNGVSMLPGCQEDDPTE
jgi:hypothetical protein